MICGYVDVAVGGAGTTGESLEDYLRQSVSRHLLGWPGGNVQTHWTTCVWASEVVKTAGGRGVKGGVREGV